MTSVGRCERCQTVLEPYITDQWFVRMRELAEPAVRAVRERKVRFHPERWTKVYLDWMENIRDWNISRRLWWGHQIPVWHCDACGEMVASRDRPARCPNGHGSLRQEEQILDTWFSSGIWPLATLGWPKETPELRYFYPGDVLVTGRDIIFLWVARMIMFGLKFMGGVPFTDVYIHPNVLNLEGKRMSKSLGTGLDPIDYIEALGYGADALRFALVLRSSQSQQDLRFGEKMLDDVRNFNNKIWNIARFVRMNLEGFDPAREAASVAGPPARGGRDLSSINRWILSRYARTVREVTRNLEDFEFDKVAQILYDFIWGTYADWYVELAKVDLFGQPGDAARRHAQWTLWTVLEGMMRLLHPIMPHITEEVWQLLPHTGESIMVSPWPESPEAWIDDEAERVVDRLIAVIHAIRSLRADLGVDAKAAIAPVLQAPDGEGRRVLEAMSRYVVALTRARDLTFLAPDASPPARAAAALADGVEIFLPVGAGEIERIRGRLTQELSRLEDELARVDGRLGNADFLRRAPTQVVEVERTRKSGLMERREVVRRHLAALA
jgi:valyl-tRNA synthetase